jgi:hypothetical protein
MGTKQATAKPMNVELSGETIRLAVEPVGNRGDQLKVRKLFESNGQLYYDWQGIHIDICDVPEIVAAMLYQLNEATGGQWMLHSNDDSDEEQAAQAMEWAAMWADKNAPEPAKWSK